MTLKELYKYCVDKANEHPILFDEIHSFYDLAEMEVQDGGSIEHECELAVRDIDELIKENLQRKREMRELLIGLKACSDVLKWAEDKAIEEIVEQCHRGDWLLWLASKVDIGLQPLTLAKGHCANTIRHLMKDERSIKAVDTAIDFGEGKASLVELFEAFFAANAAADAADFADANGFGVVFAAANAAEAAVANAAGFYTASVAAKAAAYAANGVGSASSDGAASSVGCNAKVENQKHTADICRKYIGQLIIDKCNELNAKEK